MNISSGIPCKSNYLVKAPKDNKIGKNGSRLFCLGERETSLKKNVQGLILDYFSLVDLIKFLYVSKESRERVLSFIRNNFGIEVNEDVIKNYLTEQCIYVSKDFTIDEKILNFINYYSIPYHIILQKNCDLETLAWVLKNIKNIKSIDFTKLEHENRLKPNIPRFQIPDMSKFHDESNDTTSNDDSSDTSFDIEEFKNRLKPNIPRFQIPDMSKFHDESNITGFDDESNDTTFNIPEFKSDKRNGSIKEMNPEDVNKRHFFNLFKEKSISKYRNRINKNESKIRNGENADKIIALLGEKILKTGIPIKIIVGYDNKDIIESLIWLFRSYFFENGNKKNNYNQSHTLEELRKHAISMAPCLFSGVVFGLLGIPPDTVTFIFDELKNEKPTGEIITFRNHICDEEIIKSFLDSAAKDISDNSNALDDSGLPEFIREIMAYEENASEFDRRLDVFLSICSGHYPPICEISLPVYLFTDRQL